MSQKDLIKGTEPRRLMVEVLNLRLIFVVFRLLDVKVPREVPGSGEIEDAEKKTKMRQN